MSGRFEYNFFEKEYELRPAQLPFVVSLPAVKPGGRPRASSLTGHTRRISAGELELVGPLALFSSRTVLGGQPTLNLRLELPTDTVTLQAVAVSYTLLDEDETGLGYLLAADDDVAAPVENDLNCVIRARIADIEEVERQKLLRFLRNLHQPAEQTIFVMSGNGQWQEETLTVTVL